MAGHYWLKQRAITLQNECFAADLSPRDFEKLRAEKRKEQIGFDLQKLKEAEENRKQDVCRIDVLFAEAKTDHQLMLNRNLEYLMNRAVS